MAAAGAAALLYAAIQWGNADKIQKSWGDPLRDRDFTVIARPLPVDVPAPAGRSGHSAVDRAVAALLHADLRSLEVGQAYQTSLDRAIGAHDAHNKRWTVRQLAAAARDARQGASLFDGMDGLRANFVAALEAAG